MSHEELKYKELFELGSAAIFLIDNEEGKIIQCNQAAANLYQFSVEELCTMKNTDLSAEVDATKKVTETTPIVQENIVKIALRYHKKKDGTVFPVEIDGRFFELNGRKVHIASIRDITEQENNKKKLIEQNTEKSLFISILGHDLRNALGGSRQMLDIFLKDLQLDTNDKKFADLLQIKITNASFLLNDLIEWGKASLGESNQARENINISSIFGEVQKHFELKLSEKKINFLNKCNKNVNLNFDKNILLLIIRNIISNSIKFTDDNGTIEVDCELADNNFTIIMRDNGIGMDDKLLKSVFTPEILKFKNESNSTNGSGLGLLIIKEYVNLLEGEIWVDSKQSIGTSVFVKLPY